MRRTRPVAALATVLFALGLPVGSVAQDVTPVAACETGIISSIGFDRRPVFDPASTSIRPLAWVYRTMNLLHIRTQENFIRGEILLAEGDCYDDFLASESERLLDLYPFLAEARIEATPDDQGGVQLHVSTRDEWSTQVDMGITYDGGPNLERVQVTESNFLGQGIFAEYTFRERREFKTQSIGLATPRLFGRTDASIAVGKSRPGTLFEEYIRYPFIGETGGFSLRHGYDRETDYFSYSTDGAESYAQVLVPAFRELLEFSFARRIGEPGSSFIAGLSLTRDVIRFDAAPEVVPGSDFNRLEPLPGPLAPAVARQLVPNATTRVGLQLGTRRFRYEEYTGLDGIRDRQLVDIGFFAGITAGRGFDVMTPSAVPGRTDTFYRAHTTFGIPVGSSLLHGVMTAEARREDGAWRDRLIEADLVGYFRTSALESHTLFVRASGAGGWNTYLPFQLSLGGREGVRSLVEDRFPGGRMFRLLVEDRIVFPWPEPGQADLGMTLFGDLGRVWPGDVAYGVDSGWQAALGFGLRIGLPAGTRNAVRADIAFPVGASTGSPIFRVNFELNRIYSGFLSQDIFRSRRLDLGPDHF